MNSTLKALLEGTTTLDDCTTTVMHYCNKIVRTFLKMNPSHGYLKDDLIGAALLTTVRICQQIQQKGDTEQANTDYLSTCVWNDLILAVKLEQTIKPPHSFKSVNVDPSDMPNRVPFGEYLDELATTDWEDSQREVELVESLDLSPVQKEILNHRLSGCKHVEVAKNMGLKTHQLKKQTKSIKRKWENL